MNWASDERECPIKTSSINVSAIVSKTTGFNKLNISISRARARDVLIFRRVHVSRRFMAESQEKFLFFHMHFAKR